MRRLICIALVATAVLLTAGDHRAGQADLGASSIAAQTAASAPAASGMIVQIDPVTGLPVEPTPETVRDLQNLMGPEVIQSTFGLVEKPSVVVGGGYVVDLQGRFQHTMTVTIDGSGAHRSACTSAADAPQTAATGEVK